MHSPSTNSTFRGSHSSGLANAGTGDTDLVANSCWWRGRKQAWLLGRALPGAGGRYRNGILWKTPGLHRRAWTVWTSPSALLHLSAAREEGADLQLAGSAPLCPIVYGTGDASGSLPLSRDGTSEGRSVVFFLVPLIISDVWEHKFCPSSD